MLNSILSHWDEFITMLVSLSHQCDVSCFVILILKLLICKYFENGKCEHQHLGHVILQVVQQIELPMQLATSIIRFVIYYECVLIFVRYFIDVYLHHYHIFDVKTPYLGDIVQLFDTR